MSHKRKLQGENAAKRNNVQQMKLALFVITVVATVAVNFICRRSYNLLTLCTCHLFVWMKRNTNVVPEA